MIRKPDNQTTGVGEEEKTNLTPVESLFGGMKPEFAASEAFAMIAIALQRRETIFTNVTPQELINWVLEDPKGPLSKDTIAFLEREGDEDVAFEVSKLRAQTIAHVIAAQERQALLFGLKELQDQILSMDRLS